MTVEEIEIIVTAKVEEALKEFQKIVPTIKQSMKQAQEAFSKVDTKAMTNKLNQSIQFVKKKIQDLRKSSKNNEIAIKVNNKEAQKQISQVQKQIDSLQEKINARQMKLNIINPQIDKIVDDTRKNVTPEGISPNDKSMDNVVNNALSSNKDFTSLNNQAQKLYMELEMYNKQLNEAKLSMEQLKQQTFQTATAQNKLSSFFSAFKTKLQQTNSSKQFDNMSKSINKGISTVKRYVLALFSIRTAYTVISRAANAYLSMDTQLANQIQNTWAGLGAMLAPLLEWLANIFSYALAYINAFVKALFGIDMVARANSKALKGQAKATNNLAKEQKGLAGIHDEINNVQDNSDVGGADVGGGISQIDLPDIPEDTLKKIEKFANNVKSIFNFIKENWQLIVIAFAGIAAAILVINIAMAPITISALAIAVAIGVVIAVIVSLVLYWDEITQWLSQTWEWIKQKAIEIWNAIAEFFKRLWQSICDVATKIWNNIKDFFKNLWEGIKNVAITIWEAIKSFFQNTWNKIKETVSTVFNKIKETISNIWNNIKTTITNVVTTIKDKVSTAFTNIKDKIATVMNNVKTTLSNIWNGIWSTIKGVINSIITGIEKMCNVVIRGINKILTPLTKVGNTILEAVGIKGFSFSTIAEISLPRLAKGGVLTEATAVVAGEYSGAKSNPEIVTPQSIMEETFDRVMSRYEGNNDDKPINLAVYVGNTKLGQILLDDLRNMKRRSGKDIEALLGG